MHGFVLPLRRLRRPHPVESVLAPSQRLLPCDVCCLVRSVRRGLSRPPFLCLGLRGLGLGVSRGRSVRRRERAPLWPVLILPLKVYAEPFDFAHRVMIIASGADAFVVLIPNLTGFASVVGATAEVEPLADGALLAMVEAET